jgi:hypothetical protein
LQPVCCARFVQPAWPRPLIWERGLQAAKDGRPLSARPDEIRSAMGRVGMEVSRGRTPVGCGESDQEWLVALLQDVDLTQGNAYRDLAKELRAAIVSGQVPVSARLPPQRELARRLSIGRTTVVAAYNLLRAESLLVMRQGAGTWVARRPVPSTSGAPSPAPKLDRCSH